MGRTVRSDHRLFALLIILGILLPLLSETGFAEALRDQDPARPTASPTPPTEADEDVVRIKTNPTNLKVRVNRPGVKVLSRVEGLAPKAVTAKGQLTANPFASPLSANEIHLTLTPEIATAKRREVITSCRLDLSNVEARAREDGRQDFSLKLSIRVAGPRISVAVRDNYSGKAGNSRVFYEVR